MYDVLGFFLLLTNCMRYKITLETGPGRFLTGS